MQLHLPILIVILRNGEYAILKSFAIKRTAATAWTKDVPTVLEIPISPQVPPLI